MRVCQLFCVRVCAFTTRMCILRGDVLPFLPSAIFARNARLFLDTFETNALFVFILFCNIHFFRFFVFVFVFLMCTRYIYIYIYNLLLDFFPRTSSCIFFFFSCSSLFRCENISRNRMLYNFVLQRFAQMFSATLKVYNTFLHATHFRPNSFLGLRWGAWRETT